MCIFDVSTENCDSQYVCSLNSIIFTSLVLTIDVLLSFNLVFKTVAAATAAEN